MHLIYCGVLGGLVNGLSVVRGPGEMRVMVTDTTASYLSTAMATRVKTEAETEIPWTIPLILHTRLPKGHPERKQAVRIAAIPLQNSA